MSTISTTDNTATKETEKTRLQDFYATMDPETRKAHALSLGIKLDDNNEIVVDRLTRYELRRQFGDAAAEWDSYIDRDGTQGNPSGTDIMPMHITSSSPLENPVSNARDDNASRKTQSQGDNIYTNANGAQVPPHAAVRILQHITDTYPPCWFTTHDRTCRKTEC